MFNKDLTKRYKDAHDVKSREVTEDDIPRVILEAEVLRKLCFMPIGIKSGGYAVAHQQITDKDPLRFFVKKSGEIVINPIVLYGSAKIINSSEGCLSFPNLEDVNVRRHKECIVEYQTIEDGKLTEAKKKDASGRDSKIFQHEIDHFECKYIY